jgi:hypothetical protein
VSDNLTDLDDDAEGGDDDAEDGGASCPYCQADPLFGECEHLVAAWNDGDGYWKLPFDDAPEPPEDLWAWSDAQWRAAFGDLGEAARAFREAYGERDREDWAAFEALVERLTAPVDRVGWEVDGMMTSSAGTYFFSPEPQRVRDEFTELLARLAEGLRRLEAMPPAAPDPRPGPA